ncbi:MAG: uncharacterized protein JWQ71_3353 [Pedosphaera sp.]|nr:uncharacterized protein [Pedosphaera sp.]
MTRFIAFLRSINVGGRNVKMDELRRLFESLGFSNVETFIASGNVIFESTARNAKTLEKKIEVKLQEALGYSVAVFVRSADELADIANYQPFKGAGADAGLYIAFLPEPPEKAIREKLLSFKSKTDEFHFHNRELYWLCHTRFSDSTFSGPLLEKILGVKATIRNSTTVRKIAAKHCPP